MRYAILADIHANHEALEAVLTEASNLGADKIVCCGDVVGYMADPVACTERLRGLGIVTVAGNHDLAAAGRKDPAIMWDLAEKTARWTQRHLTENHKTWLASLPGEATIDDRLLLIHGALHPETTPEDLHLTKPEDIQLSLDALVRHDSTLRVCFFGHTHIPTVHRLRAKVVETLPAVSMTLAPDSWYLINPGSVGLPRDGRPGAAFAMFDTEAGRVDFIRVTYDEARARAKCIEAGLTRDPPLLRKLKRAVRKVKHMLRGPETSARTGS
jgi:predicted phosphodiesterase